jgi:hypothetical protein
MEDIKAFLSYTTVRQVSIRNWKWGLMYYLLVRMYQLPMLGVSDLFSVHHRIHRWLGDLLQ